MRCIYKCMPRQYGGVINRIGEVPHFIKSLIRIRMYFEYKV